MCRTLGRGGSRRAATLGLADVAHAHPHVVRCRPKNTSVYVSGLPRDTTDQELAQVFGKIGLLHRIKMYRLPNGELKGDALVTYDVKAGDAAVGAERLLNCKELRTGWRMSVVMADFNASLTPAEVPSEESQHAVADRRVVLLRNVFRHASTSEPNFLPELENDIAAECSKCGRVLAVCAQPVEKSDGHIRLVFGTGQEAGKCVAMMNGRRFDGRVLTARLLEPEPGDPPADSPADPPAAKGVTGVTSGQLNTQHQPTSSPPTAATAAPTSTSATGDDLDSFFASLL